MPACLSENCEQLLAEQGGVIARWQAPTVDLDPSLIDRRLRQGRWQPLYRGTYATFTGWPKRESLLWGAVLRAGPGAALSHQTAAELDGLTDTRLAAIHVTVSSQREIKVTGAERGARAPRIIVHQSRRLAAALHPVRVPPRTRVEETVLDLARAAASFDEALAWTVAACERRRTTHAALLTAMGARSRMRWRAELTAALDDIGAGIQSVLEFRYVQGVERPHGLPAGKRQARQSRGARSNYLDTLYADFGLAVELDGRAAHRARDRWRDAHRDNFLAAAGIATLRYSWADVTERPCQVAGEVGRALRKRGWPGSVSRCGLTCAVEAGR
ncbi:MAG: DUF559 domain-containing protein [Streptosporangiaceae bacterium]